MNIFKKGVVLLTATAMTFAGLGGYAPAGTAYAADSNLLKDPGFEEFNNSWKGLYGDGAQVGKFLDQGNNCLKITSNTVGWTCVYQDVQLKPNTDYKLTGWIKGENIVAEEFCDGAAIDVESSTAYYIDSENNFESGTFEKQVTTYFRTSGKGKTRIRCRLGHYWGGSKGTAYFDNLKLEECPYPETNRTLVERENVRTYMTTDSLVSLESYSKWADLLQESYEKYEELTGCAPFCGDQLMVINSDEPWMGRYGGVANYNPIRLNPNAKRGFEDFEENGDVGFGVMHEMSHTFDSDWKNNDAWGWNFASEFWANTKMLYVLDTTDDIVVGANGKVATNSKEMGEYLYKVAGGGYDAYLKEGTYSDKYHDALTYVFIQIINKIGWEPFVATFHQYTSGEIPCPKTDLAKYDRFMYQVQQNYHPGGNEVVSCFPDGMYEQVREYFYSLCPYYNDELESERLYYSEKTEELIKSLKAEDSVWIKTILTQQKNKIEHAGCVDEAELEYRKAEEVMQGKDRMAYQSMGEQSDSYDAEVKAGQLSGTENQGTKITKLKVTPYNAWGIQVRGFVDHGWTNWNDEVDGDGKGIEGIQIKLKHPMAGDYEVYYRTYNSEHGWLGWTKNGETAGTLNMGSAIEGFQVLLLPQNMSAEGITNDSKESYLGAEVTSTPTPAETVKVFYDAQGGQLSDTQDYVICTVGEEIPTLATAVKDGYEFTGWYTSPKGGEKVESGKIYQKGDFDKLYAHYSLKKYTVSFDANGGVMDAQEMKICYGEKYGVLPIPTKEGAKFLGWSTEKTGGTFINNESRYSIRMDQCLYAVWEDEGKLTDTPTPTIWEKISVTPTQGITDVPTPTDTLTCTPTMTQVPSLTPTITEKAEPTKEVETSITAKPEPTKEIEPSITVKPEPTKEVKPSITVKPEPTKEVKPSITVKPEPTKEIEPSITAKPEPTKEIEPSITAKPEPTKEIKPTWEPEPTKISSDLRITQLTVKPKTQKAHVGDKVTLCAKAKGEAIEYQFSYTYKDKTVVIKEYSEENTASFIPKKDGNYTIKVSVRDGLGNTATKKINTYKVLKKYAVQSVKFTGTGNKRQIKVKMQGAEGTVKFSYQVKYQGKVLKKTSYTKQSLSLKFSKKGTYYITVSAKDTKNNRVIKKTVKCKVK